MAGVQEWAEILKGESVQGLTFSNDGKLLYQGEVLLPEILVSYISNGDIIYAQRLIISDLSPSGRFNIVKACEGTTSGSGLCWSVYLVDRQAETTQKVDIANTADSIGCSGRVMSDMPYLSNRWRACPGLLPLICKRRKQRCLSKRLPLRI